MFDVFVFVLVLQGLLCGVTVVWYCFIVLLLVVYVAFCVWLADVVFVIG